MREHPGLGVPVLRGTGQVAARGAVPGRLAPRGRTRGQADPATEDQKWLVTQRAEAQQVRDLIAAAGQDTGRL